MIVEEPDRVRSALEGYATGEGDFADYLILESARAAGCERLASLDAALLEQPDVVAP